jgi:hypothetical protein
MSPQNLLLRSLRHPIAFGSVLVALSAASVSGITSFQFVTPIFGLTAAQGGSLMVADAGAGIVELRSGGGRLIAELPRATDVAPIGRGQMFATRGGGTGQTTGALFRVSLGNVRQIADLYMFERDATRIRPQSTPIRSTWKSSATASQWWPMPAATIFSSSTISVRSTGSLCFRTNWYPLRTPKRFWVARRP